MQDLWRLSAKDIAAPDKVEKDFGEGGGIRGAGPARRGQPRDQRRGRRIGLRTCWRRPHPIDAAIARNEDVGRAGRRARYRQGQYRSAGVCHHQRPQAAARRHCRDQQSGDRQSAQGGRGDSRAHQLPGVFLPLVHHQPDPWRHQKSARRRHHARAARPAGQGRRSPPASGISRTAPISRDRSAIRPMPAAFMACGRRRPRRGLQRVAARAHHRAADLGGIGPAGAHHRRSQDRACMRCPARMCAIPGGCRRRWKALRCRSARRCVLRRTVWRRLRK